MSLLNINLNTDLEKEFEQFLDYHTELKDLYGHILNLSSGDFTPIQSKGFAFSEYFGMDTHADDFHLRYNVSKEFWCRYQAAFFEGEKKLVCDSLGKVEGHKELLEKMEKLIGSPRVQHNNYRLETRIGKIK